MNAYPVKINGLGYFIDIDSWRGRDIIDFSPRASVPGTGQVYSDLGLYQPIVQNNWQEGFGFIWHDAESGYLETIGDIDTRHKGLVMRMTQSVSGETNNNVKNGGVVYGAYVYFWGVAGVRRWSSGGGWEAIEVMRPILDVTSSASDDGISTGGTITVSHTVTPDSGGDTAAYVAVAILEGNLVTSVTVQYGAGSMNEISDTGATAPRVFAFRSNSLAAGAANVVATINFSGGGTVEALISCHTFTNIHGSAQEGTIVTKTSSGATVMSSATTGTRDRELVLQFIIKDGGSSDAPVEGEGQTTLVEVSNDAVMSLLVSTEYVKLTNQTTMSYTWTNARDVASIVIPIEMVAEVEVNFMLQNGAQLFAAPDGKRLMRIASADATSGTDWLPTGINNNSIDYKWGLIHSGYIYWGKDGDTDVYRDNDDELDNLAGDPGDVSGDVSGGQIPVGAGTIATLGAASFIEKLAVSRDDGLYMIADDNIARLKLGFANDSSANNFRSMAIFGGELYFPIRDQILRWNGARVVDVTPGRITDTFPYSTYGRFDNFVALQSWLFCSARTNDSTYEEDILAWDGSAWHKIVDGVVTNGADQITMLTFDPLNNRLWYHIQQSGASEDTRYIAFQDQSMYPSGNFNTGGTHEIRTSRIHAGFKRITKSTPYLFVETDNLNGSSRYIEVYYNLDNDGWILWDKIKVGGVTKLSFPAGAEPTVEFNHIQLAFRFITATAAQSPILEGFALMVMLRPEVNWGYNFDVYAANDLSSGYIEDGRSGEEIMSDLRAARNSKKPVALETPFGATVLGYITSLSEHAVEYEPDDVRGGNIQQIIRVSFVQALVVGIGNTETGQARIQVGDMWYG